MSWTLELHSASVEDTLRLGRALGRALRPGDVVALVGRLGAGKTHLAKGIAAGLGVVDDRCVSSPTFVLVNEYPARLPLHHVDAYRLAGAAQLAAIGFEELCAEGGVVLVEWADRVREIIPAAAIWISLRIEGEQERRLEVNTACLDARTRLMATGLDRK
jgi:tRNA threonylcarbamoyladenosine biosynthesis protein TsaE